MSEIEDKLFEIDQKIKYLKQKEIDLKKELYSTREEEYKNLVGHCFADYNLYFPVYYRITSYKDGVFTATRCYLISDQRQFYIGVDEFTPGRLDNFRTIKLSDYLDNLKKYKLKIEKWK